MKKTVSLLIALLLVLAVGCTNTPTPTPSASATTTAPATTDTAASAEPTATPEPIVPAEPVTVTFFWREGRDIAVPEDSYICQKILEDINVKYVHLAPAGGMNPEEFLTLRFTANEVPDIMESGFAKTVELRDMGAIMELTDYVNEQYIPNVIRNSNNWEKGVELVTGTDGKIWQLPVTNATDHQATYFIRYDWLENLGLQPPTTHEELANVLVAFSNDDPDQNGKKDTYGAHLPGMGTVQFNMGATTSNWNDQWFSDGNGGVMLGFTRPEFKAYYQYIKDIMDRGGIFNEIADQEATLGENMTQKVKAGQVGFHAGWASADDIIEMQKIQPGADWRTLTPIKGVFDQGYRTSGGVLRNTYVISAFVDDRLDAVWRLLDYMANDDSTAEAINYDAPYWEASYGKRGVNWDVVDGVFFCSDVPLVKGGVELEWTKPIALTNEAELYNTNCRRWRTVYSYVAARTGWSEYRIAAYDAEETWPTSVSLQMTKFGIDPNVPMYLEGVEPTEGVQKFTNDWFQTEKLRTFTINWLLGRRDIDSDFEAMIKQAENEGLRDIEKEMTEHLKSLGKL